MAQAVQFESKIKRDKLAGEVEDMEKLAKRQNILESTGIVQSGSFGGSVLNDREMFKQKLASKKKQLGMITPPSPKEMEEKSGMTIDQMIKRHKQLSSFIVNPQGQFPRMLSREEMTECPPGADDLNRLHHTKIAHHTCDKNGDLVSVDHSKGQMPAYVEYKNWSRILGLDSEAELDSSLANMELLRPDRVDKNDSLAQFASRVYANPASRLTAQEYEDRVGIEGLNAIQKEIHELEKLGQMKAPDMVEQFKNLHKTNFPKDLDPVPDTASGDEPIYIGKGQWLLPDGEIFIGLEAEAVEHWADKETE